MRRQRDRRKFTEDRRTVAHHDVKPVCPKCLVTNCGHMLRRLQPREIRVLRELLSGADCGDVPTNKEIGARLGLTSKSVKAYMRNIFAKLDMTNRASVAAWTVKNRRLLK